MKKIKFRVLEVDNPGRAIFFIPQYKTFFGWRNILNTGWALYNHQVIRSGYTVSDYANCNLRYLSDAELVCKKFYEYKTKKCHVICHPVNVENI